ncbi:hypothetical protein [Planctomicrobium sp. SH664]|uniref:hypothetical protein n=1 Tax=Planctomicrobium sp. SH664 TaxID=3448125 RepID=UPI003F5B5983
MPALNPAIDSRAEFRLELLLVLITLALTCVLSAIESSQYVILNLFFLPVIVAALSLGRYRAGVLALLSVVLVTLVIMHDLEGFAFGHSPLAVALCVMVWGAVLGLTAILAGTMSDDRAARTADAAEAQISMVEVLKHYLQGTDSDARQRSRQVDRLARKVAQRLQLPEREIENMRRAALLMELEHLDITARVVRRTLDQYHAILSGEHQPLNAVTAELEDTLAATLNKSQSSQQDAVAGDAAQSGEAACIGTRILSTVRRYVELRTASSATRGLSAEEALQVLHHEQEQGLHDPGVLYLVEEVIRAQSSGGFSELLEELGYSRSSVITA